MPRNEHRARCACAGSDRGSSCQARRAPRPTSSSAKVSASSELSQCAIVRRFDDTTPRRYGRIAAATAARSRDLADRAAAEQRVLRPSLMFVDELAHLVDGADAVQVALLLRLAPREQAVAARMMPSQPGFSSTARRSISASSKPGRCQGTHTMLRP